MGWKIFQQPINNLLNKMKKGSVELGADDEEGESESKVINQTTEAVFPHKGVFFTDKTGLTIFVFLFAMIFAPSSTDPFFIYLEYLHAKKMRGKVEISI